MLTLLGNSTRTCDGVSRRNFLRVGSLGLGGLTLPNLLRARAGAAEGEKGNNGRSTASRKSVILIYLAGGPSHIDMYDLKPEAPAEFRGEFKPISTKVPGFDIGEHLPLQSRIMDKMSVVRSACHTNAGHGMGSQWMQTGWHATLEVNDNLYPSIGSIVSKMKGPNEPGLPAYCNVPRALSFGKAAYLGASYNPFCPDGDPNQPNFEVKNLRLPGRVPADRLAKRRNLVAQIDTIRRDIDAKGDLDGLDTFYREAMTMITDDKAIRAFDINREDPRLRERYGRTDLGQSCLLARRLCEAGVTFVAVQAGGGWDTHGDNFGQLKKNLLPNYDRALTGLIDDIYDRGLQDDILVMSYGEFGRTPRINGGAGRDHWPQAMSVVFSGGGMKMGQAIGTTDSKAEYPTSKPYTPGCILSTMYRYLGIDHHTPFYDHARRPLPILNEGEPIVELG
jgi:hypothetical protein